MQIDPFLLCIKLKPKWIKDLNTNPATLNLIEEKVGNTLELIGTGEGKIFKRQNTRKSVVKQSPLEIVA